MTTGASAVLTIGDISVKLKDTHDAHPQGVAIAMAHGAGLRLLQRQVWRDTASFTKEAAWEHCLLNHPQIQPIFHLPVRQRGPFKMDCCPKVYQNRSGHGPSYEYRWTSGSRLPYAYQLYMISCVPHARVSLRLNITLTNP
eukprot:gene28641-35527_t